MNQPTIVAKQPAVLELEPGTYYFCACGNSEGGVFCNGAHQGTGITPIPFTLEEKQKVALCKCKYSNNLPFCNGNHSKL